MYFFHAAPFRCTPKERSRGLIAGMRRIIEEMTQHANSPQFHRKKQND
jgi:hypothetical protein